MTTSSVPSTRFQRGIALAEERFEEIERVRPWIWEVPSCSGPGTHFVDVRRGDCTCPDRVPEGEECKHTVAARYIKARTAKCSGCCKRFRHRELYDVGEDHLTFFEGDLLCGDCAQGHGLLSPLLVGVVAALTAVLLMLAATPAHAEQMVAGGPDQRGCFSVDVEEDTDGNTNTPHERMVEDLLTNQGWVGNPHDKAVRIYSPGCKYLHGWDSPECWEDGEFAKTDGCLGL